MPLDIRHDRDTRRFTVDVAGHQCLLLYKLANDVMTIVHTEVPPAVGGHGIGAELVRAAFEAARTLGWKVVPACSYAAAFAAKHPEYADLIA